MGHNRVQNLFAFSNNSQMNKGDWISDSASASTHKSREPKQKEMR